MAVVKRRKRSIQRAIESTDIQKLEPKLPVGLNSERLLVPVRDFDLIHNYTDLMWSTIQEHFNGDPKVAVEIGSRRGAWAAGLMTSTKKTELFCIDHWGGRMGVGNLCAWLKRVEGELFKRCHPLRGTSGEWARTFPYSIDLLFIDGSHDYPSVRFDINSWKRLMNDGGLIIGHDYQIEGVKKAADEIFGEDKLKTIRAGVQKSVTWMIAT